MYKLNVPNDEILHCIFYITMAEIACTLFYVGLFVSKCTYSRIDIILL